MARYTAAVKSFFGRDRMTDTPRVPGPPSLPKVLTVFGTRPEAVKLGPVILELARHADRIASRVCVTAQHRDMLDQVLHVFGIQPDYDLDIMQGNQTPTQVAAAVLARLGPA